MTDKEGGDYNNMARRKTFCLASPNVILSHLQYGVHVKEST
jgi:hypothetical protein